MSKHYRYRHLVRLCPWRPYNFFRIWGHISCLIFYLWFRTYRHKLMKLTPSIYVIYVFFSLLPSMSTRPSVMLLWTFPMDCWSVMSICRMAMVSLCRSLTLSSKRCFLSRLRMVAYTEQDPQSKMQSILCCSI